MHIYHNLIKLSELDGVIEHMTYFLGFQGIVEAYPCYSYYIAIATVVYIIYNFVIVNILVT